MNKIVVTYKNADLDCVASAYAYAEYLTKMGINSSYYISGLVQDEVNIVCKIFNILLKVLFPNLCIKLIFTNFTCFSHIITNIFYVFNLIFCTFFVKDSK